MKYFYKKILSFIFFFINKNYFLVKKNKYYSSNKYYSGSKKYKIFTLRNGKIYYDTSECRYFYIYKQFILPELSIDIKGLTSSSNIFKYGITKICKKFDLNVFSVISGRDPNDNYAHWLLDVLPRLIILERLFKKYTKINLLVPGYDKPYQKDSIKYLILDKKVNILSLNNNKFCKFNKIVSCSNFTAGNYSHYYDKNLLTKIKNKILDQAKKRLFFKNKKFSKIYLSRADASKKKHRYLKNNLEIENYLIKKGFKVLTLSNYSLLEQSLIFNHAKIVIGLHGAGFANLIFSKKGTKIIEIGSLNWKDTDAYKKLSTNLNLNYKRILIKKEENNPQIIKLPLNVLKKYV